MVAIAIIMSSISLVVGFLVGWVNGFGSRPTVKPPGYTKHTVNHYSQSYWPDTYNHIGISTKILEYLVQQDMIKVNTDKDMITTSFTFYEKNDAN